MNNRKAIRVYRFVILALILVPWRLGLAVTQSSNPSEKTIALAEDGTPKACIVLDNGNREALKFPVAELERYLTALSGAKFEIIQTSDVPARPSNETLILIGGPSRNGLLSELVKARLTRFEDLKPEGFILKTARWKNRAVVIAGGNDEAGDWHAVFELIERLGVTFQLTGDIMPDKRARLVLPALDLRSEPAFSRRGFMLPIVFEHLTLFSYEDYVKFIDQMVKMKCNYLQVWWFTYAPFLKISYKGETKWMGDVSKKESGYLSWAHSDMGSFTTDLVTIGKEHFKGSRVTAPEFQNVQNPDQAFEVAQNLMQRVIRHATERKIKVWIAIEISALPPNLARHAERVGDLPFHPIFGTYVHPLDPVNREIQVEQLKALFKTYPEAEGYFLVLTELYPQLYSEKYKDFFGRERPKFHDLRILRYPWVDWFAGGGSDRLVDSNVAYFDLLQYLIQKKNEIAPNVKLGAMGVGRGYLLPLLDKMLPKDIALTDLESSGVWTPMGVPMDYFGGMGNRERTIIPRIDDDVNMMGMQFSVRQYAVKDKIFSDGLKYGLTGHSGQVERARGTESNSRFLAEAAWAPHMTPEDFYKNYTRRLFGERAAEHMYRAYMSLEDHEAYLGYYNHGYSTMNCCGALPEVSTTYLYSKQENPFDGPRGDSWNAFLYKNPDVVQRYEGSIQLLNQALQSLQAAAPLVEGQGKYHLNYMINRTEAYRDYIHSLVTIRRAYESFDRAFKNREKVSHEQFVTDLEKSLGGFENALEEIQAATRKYAEIIDHPSDLAVLYHLNVRGILGFELTHSWMRNVANFHKGRDYLEHVPFEKLFSVDLHLHQATQQ